MQFPKYNFSFKKRRSLNEPKYLPEKSPKTSANLHNKINEHT